MRKVWIELFQHNVAECDDPLLRAHVIILVPSVREWEIKHNHNYFGILYMRICLKSQQIVKNTGRNEKDILAVSDS